MSRRRGGLPIHGWIVLDKPVGLGSTKAVAMVRRATGAAKAGHAGTLDPLASGILPVALGEATKTVPFGVDGQKRYRLTIRWGQATGTDDAEGDIIAESAIRPDEPSIRAALTSFTGDILQVPSSYSAVHINGERAYNLARRGVNVTLPARRVRIDRIDLIAVDDHDHATLDVSCGKGVYMRSLGRDLAQALGTVGHLSALKRLSVGPFGLKHAISVDQLGELGHIEGLSKHLLPIETALDDIPALALTEAEALHVRQGRSVRPLCLLDGTRIDAPLEGAMVSVSAAGRLVGIAKFDAGSLRPVRVLNL